MKISHLKTYLKVASTKSFTRAAQDLFMTQPTVTNHIQSLEQELGYQLIVRSSSGIRLTAKGEELLQKVSEIFRLIDELKNDTETQDNGICGTLNIAASSVMGTHFLTPILKATLEKYPNIDIRLHFGTAYSIATWVQDGFVDLGFAPRSPGFQRLNFTSLLVEPCIIAISTSQYAPCRMELDQGDLSGQRFILREKGTQAHDRAIRWLKKQAWHTPMRTPIILSDMESIKNLVLEGGGMTIIPRCCVKKHIEQGSMKEIKPNIPVGIINYFMIERLNENDSSIISIFKKMLLQDEK